jgi:hypothetical protein
MVAVLFGVVLIENAEGGLMTFTAQNRYVEVDGGGLFPFSRLAAHGFEDFDAQLEDSGYSDEDPWFGDAQASAGQESVLSSQSVVARGWAEAMAMDSEGASGKSRLEVAFTVTQKGFYSLQGSFHGMAGPPEMPPEGSTASGVKLRRSNGTYLLDLNEFYDEYNLTLYASGILPPDTYTLICYSEAGAFGPMMGEASASFDVTLDVTPEPATLTLLALGGLSLLRRRKRRACK